MTQNLSDTELLIMEIIWDIAPEPARFAFLMDSLSRSGHPCQKNTLITLLRRLIAKGFLKSRKMRNANEYSAIVGRDEFRAGQVRSFVNKYYEGQASGLVNALIQADMLSSEDYEELKAAAEEAQS